MTLSGKNPDSDRFVAPQVKMQPQRRPDSSYSTMSAPISTSGDMKPGFLPPINPGNQRGNGGPYSDVGPRTNQQQQRVPPDQFPHSNDATDPSSYSQVSDAQSVHSQDSQPRRRPFALSPMAHFAHDNEDENTVIEEDNNSQALLDEPDDTDNDNEDEDNESQSSSASVDSETGDRVYSYNEEYWDESAGRFVTKSVAPAVVYKIPSSPRAAAALGVNPVVAAYGNDPANANGAAPRHGYAARALLKQQLKMQKETERLLMQRLYKCVLSCQMCDVAVVGVVVVVVVVVPWLLNPYKHGQRHSTLY